MEKEKIASLINSGITLERICIEHLISGSIKYWNYTDNSQDYGDLPICQNVFR